MVYGYIYKIENLVNGKIYIGLTTSNPCLRKYHHFYNLKNRRHANFHLQNAFNKYGESNFKFIVLNYATDKKTLDELEVAYITYYDCLNHSKGYNFQSGGANGKHSPETKQKISLKNSGESHGMYGEFHSTETRKKISESLMGRKLSKETCKKMSEAKKGENNPFYGVSPSKSTRKKLSISNKGKTRSEDARKKYGLSKRGNGLFGFTGTTYIKKMDPEKRCWRSYIVIKGHQKSLNLYEDPLSAEIVHDLVFEEIYK